jgi:hypothetical protein
MWGGEGGGLVPRFEQRRVVGKGGDGELERQQRSRGERRGNKGELSPDVAATQGIKARHARGGGCMRGAWSGGAGLVGSVGVRWRAADRATAASTRSRGCAWDVTRGHGLA